MNESAISGVDALVRAAVKAEVYELHSLHSALKHPTRPHSSSTHSRHRGDFPHRPLYGFDLCPAFEFIAS